MSEKSTSEFSDHDSLRSPKPVKIDPTQYIFLKRGHSGEYGKNIFQKIFPTKFSTMLKNRGNLEKPPSPSFFRENISPSIPICIALNQDQFQILLSEGLEDMTKIVKLCRIFFHTK